MCFFPSKVQIQKHVLAVWQEKLKTAFFLVSLFPCYSVAGFLNRDTIDILDKYIILCFGKLSCAL